MNRNKQKDLVSTFYTSINVMLLHTDSLSSLKIFIYSFIGFHYGIQYDQMKITRPSSTLPYEMVPRNPEKGPYIDDLIVTKIIR